MPRRDSNHAVPFTSSYRGATPNAGKPTPHLGGYAPPPPPRPLSLDRQRKGGKKARPWRCPRGFCLRRATPALPLCPHTGVAGVARTGPCAKALQPAGTRQGQKNTAQATPQKTHHPQNWKCVIEKFFTYAFYSDATSFKMTLHF